MSSKIPTIAEQNAKLREVFEGWKSAPVSLYPLTLETWTYYGEKVEFYGINNWFFPYKPKPVDGEIGYDHEKHERIVLERRDDEQ